MLPLGIAALHSLQLQSPTTEAIRKNATLKPEQLSFTNQSHKLIDRTSERIAFLVVITKKNDVLMIANVQKSLLFVSPLNSQSIRD